MFCTPPRNQVWKHVWGSKISILVAIAQNGTENPHFRDKRTNFNRKSAFLPKMHNFAFSPTRSSARQREAARGSARQTRGKREAARGSARRSQKLVKILNLCDFYENTQKTFTTLKKHAKHAEKAQKCAKRSKNIQNALKMPSQHSKGAKRSS